MFNGTPFSPGGGGGAAVTSVNGATGVVVLPLTGRLIGAPIILTGAGTYTPTGSQAYVIAQGAGGATAGQPASTTALIASARLGASAGAGSWCIKFFSSLAASYAFSAGAGGVGGAAGANNGTDGGDTTFGSGPVILTAFGGKGVVTSPGGALAQFGGLGGALATGGDYNSCGQNGGVILALGDSNPAITRHISSGGSTPRGAGGRGVNALQGVNTRGENGTGYGGGASGSVSNDGSTAVAGRDGAPGAILIFEYS